jgi:hypothetical protein
MKFTTVLATIAMAFATTAVAVAVPNSNVRNPYPPTRRAEMVETGPVQLCAALCYKGSRWGDACGGDGGGSCPGGTCEEYCD